MKIKHLIWRNGRAETPFGTYQLYHINRGWWFEFRAEWKHDSVMFKTKRETQAAAQADFERRVRECCEGEQNGEA